MSEGTSFGEHGLELKCDCIVVRLANARQRLSTLFKEKTVLQRPSYELTPIAEEFNKEAGNIDNELQNGTARFPSTWCYQRYTLSNPRPWPTRDFYSPIVSSRSSSAYAALWNEYDATRMLINSTRLRMLELSHPGCRRLRS